MDGGREVTYICTLFAAVDGRGELDVCATDCKIYVESFYRCCWWGGQAGMWDNNERYQPTQHAGGIGNWQDNLLGLYIVPGTDVHIGSGSESNGCIIVKAPVIDNRG